MRIMMIVKANKESEAGVMPEERLLAEMGKYNEELVNAGMMLEGAGLDPTSKGARIRFSNSSPTVVHGPFKNPEDQIAGFWIIKATSMEDAISWAKRIPFKDGEVELRRLTELEDFEPGAAIDGMKDLRSRVESAKAAA